MKWYWQVLIGFGILLIQFGIAVTTGKIIHWCNPSDEDEDEK
jgi:hypothetical protein